MGEGGWLALKNLTFSCVATLVYVLMSLVGMFINASFDVFSMYFFIFFVIAYFDLNQYC